MGRTRLRMRRTIGIAAVVLAVLGGWALYRAVGDATGEPPATPPAAERSGAPPAAPAPPLVPGRMVHRRAAAGGVDRYALRLAAGEFLAVDVVQDGVDVALALAGPGGTELLAADSPNGERGTERLETVAMAPGVYVLSVVAAGPAGAYTLRLTGPRPASPDDRRRAAAGAAYWEAETLRRRGSESFPAALAAYDRALALARQAGDRGRQALALRRIGQVAEGLGRRGEALAAFVSSLDHYRALGDRWEQALLHYDVGRLYRAGGAHGAAAESYTAALVRFAEHGDLSRQASALNILGLVHAERGAGQEAIDCFRGALALWRRTGEARSEAITTKNLGDVYAAMRYHGRAERLFRRALALHAAAAGDPLEMAWVLESLGTVERRMGAHGAALGSFSRALLLMRRHGDRHGEAIVLNSLGATEWRLGRAGAARALYGQARELARRIGDRSTEAYARVNLGWLDEVEGRTDAAVAHHRAALATFREGGDPRGETSALFGLARAERRRGDLAAARVGVEAALAGIERLGGGVADVEARSAFLADRHGYYEFLVDLLIEMGEPAAALQASERGRARVLLELLRLGRANLTAGVAPELLAREREVAARLEAVALERLRRTTAGRPAAAAVAAALPALTEELAEVRGRIRAQNPSYAALAAAEAPTLDAVRARLDDETLVVEIALGEERSFLWVVGRRLLVHRVLPPRAALEAQVRRARRLLELSHVPLFRRQLDLVLDDLGRTLLEPVAGHLTARRLVIVADGVLQLFPFGALPLGEPAAGAGRSLVSRYEIVQLPSLAVLAVLREREAVRRTAPMTLAVFGDPVFPRAALDPTGAGPVDEDAAETGFSPTWFRALPSSRREAEAILALVPPRQRFAALGRDARRDRVMGGGLDRFRIVHFATHGLLNHEHPELSGIALAAGADGTARGAVLWAYQVYGLDLPVELVVLSACQTALGKEVRGEGVLGLTRGFMHAGATRVVVSLWKVDDAATAELMTRFYDALLRRRLPAAAALRDAQLSLAREGRWAPSHWAGFVLQGDWR